VFRSPDSGTGATASICSSPSKCARRRAPRSSWRPCRGHGSPPTEVEPWWSEIRRLIRRNGMRLPPLPGATREAERIAALYPGSRLLTGSQARRSALVDLLGASSVFHFAGHAIGNASWLRNWRAASVQPRAGSAVGVQHTQSTVEPHGRDRRVGVQLPACRGARDDQYPVGRRRRRDRGAAGRVSPPLFERTPPAEALRLAQLQAMRSDRPELRTARAWAAFIYTGP
jgi:CHAT domain